jgi:hypothetical protein
MIFELINPFNSFEKALAYLDPGTGSYIIQILLATLLGLLFLIRKQWAQIKRFLVSNLHPKKHSQTVHEEDQKSDSFQP